MLWLLYFFEQSAPVSNFEIIVKKVVDKKSISIFESGAILMYLAEKTGKFFPQTSPDKERVLETNIVIKASMET